MEGLIETCDLLKKVSQDDGSGSVVSTTTIVVADLSCRRTKLTGEDQSGRVGTGGPRVWRFSTYPIPSLPELEVTGEPVGYIIQFSGFLYDVSWWEARRDGTGRLDHMEFRTEQR